MLFIIGTPIGNSKDITFRQAEIICSSDILLAEDTRTAHALLSSVTRYFRLQPKNDLKIISYYREKEMEKLPEILEYLKNDLTVSMISDSGMPLLSDPGLMLLRSVVRECLPYTVVPGPSAVTTAFIHSVPPGQDFLFLGFLPKKLSARKKRLNTIKEVKQHLPELEVLCFESATRIKETLLLIKTILPDTQISICREMTKKHEQIIRGSAKTILEEVQEDLRGEITLAIH